MSTEICTKGKPLQAYSVISHTLAAVRMLTSCRDHLRKEADAVQQSVELLTPFQSATPSIISITSSVSLEISQASPSPKSDICENASSYLDLKDPSIPAARLLISLSQPGTQSSHRGVVSSPSADSSARTADGVGEGNLLHEPRGYMSSLMNGSSLYEAHRADVRPAVALQHQNNPMVTHREPVRRWQPMKTPLKVTQPTRRSPHLDIFNRLPMELRDPFKIMYYFNNAGQHVLRQTYMSRLTGDRSAVTMNLYSPELRLAAVYYYLLAKETMNLVDIAIALRLDPDSLKDWISSCGMVASSFR
jgi:hypothetical protein